MCAGAVVVAAIAGCARQPVAGPIQPVPSVASAPTLEQDAGPGDAPPNYADNNSWKQRSELSAADKKEGDRLAGRIRPLLTDLRAAGDFAPESTRAALLGLGLAADKVGVSPMRASVLSGSEQVPAGAVFEVHFGERGCIIGDIRPERLLIEVRGSAAEYGCLEPYTH
jgi:hypothetical protein